MRHADGSWRWHITNAVPIKDAAGAIVGGEGIARDITERKQAESERDAAFKALHESEAKYRQLVESLNEGIWMIDENAATTFVNPRMAEMLGYTVEEMSGRQIFSFMDKPFAQNATRGLARLQQGFKEPHDIELLCKNGTRIHASLGTSRIIDLEGNYRGAIAGIVDISERKEAEKEIKRQLAEKEILLKEVHHRIKNNIASIGGLLSLHRQSVVNPEAVAALQEAIGRVDSMRILYDKLLQSTEYTDISVKNYVDSLVDAIVALFPDSTKVTVEKNIADFHLDAKRLFPLGLIINELITNKIKYAFREQG